MKSAMHGCHLHCIFSHPYELKGRIVVDLPLPRQRLVSVTLDVDYHVPPGGTGEAEIYPKVHATIGEESETIRASSSEPGGPTWILELENFLQLELLGPYSEGKTHIVLFKVAIPVGTDFFKDKGSGSVTRWFNLRFRARSRCDFGRKEDWGEQEFSVTTMSTRKAMAVQQLH